MFKNVVVLFTAIFLCACVKLTAHYENQASPSDIASGKVIDLGTCQVLVDEVESAVLAADVADSQAARIAGFPYLRVNRFLASFRHQVSGEAFAFWLDQLTQLAHSGWHIEIANLPEQSKRQLHEFTDHQLFDRLKSCSQLFKQVLFENNDLENRLKEWATVPSEYQVWKRIIGLYPLTALAFRMGIYQWHQETLSGYAIPLQELPVKGKLTRYTTSSPDKTIIAFKEIGEIIVRSSDNGLNIPLPEKEDQQKLFQFFAPVFEIDVESPDDHIGTPVLGKEGFPHIDSTKPLVFQHVSHTRLNTQILLQLNYTIWFPARTKTSVFDLLGGHLDGLTWRVTLLPDGKPFVFDTIHNCGCYHLFFPTQYAKVIDTGDLWEEPDFLPQQQLNIENHARLFIRIASRTHYVDRVYFSDQSIENVTQYSWRMADTLRSLPLPGGGFRSLYGQDGIVAGSERGERLLFWPMGIPNPGAMRQWGHHATAFVGSRHFDDPRLFENSFEILQ